MRLAQVDMEGYKINDDVKEKIKKNKELFKRMKITLEDNTTNKDVNIFNIGIEIIDIDFSRTEVVKYGNNYSLTVFDPLLFAPELNGMFYIQRKERLIRQYENNVMYNNRNDMRIAFQNILKKEKVDGIIAYGDSERTYLTALTSLSQRTIGSFLDLNSENKLVDFENNSYFYLDQEKIVELYMQDSKLNPNSNSLISVMENQKSFTNTYKYYSTKAKSIFGNVIEMINKDNELSNMINLQVHTGREDVRMQNTILEGLLKYEMLKNGTSILKDILTKSDPTKELQIKLSENEKKLEQQNKKSAKTREYEKISDVYSLSSEYIDGVLKSGLANFITKNWTETQISQEEVQTNRNIFKDIPQSQYRYIFDSESIKDINNGKYLSNLKKSNLVKLRNEFKDNSNKVKVHYKKGKNNKDYLFVSINDVQIVAKIPLYVFYKNEGRKFIELFTLFSNNNDTSFNFKSIQNDNAFMIDDDKFKELTKKIITSCKSDFKISLTEKQVSEIVNDEIERKKLETAINSKKNKKFNNSKIDKLIQVYYLFNSKKEKNIMNLKSNSLIDFQSIKANPKVNFLYKKSYETLFNEILKLKTKEIENTFDVIINGDMFGNADIKSVISQLIKSTKRHSFFRNKKDNLYLSVSYK